MTRILIKHAKEMISKGELTVHLVNLPCEVRGASCENSDGSFSVFINARHSDSRQRQAFLHEMMHIHFKDFHNEIDIDKVEALRRD